MPAIVTAAAKTTTPDPQLTTLAVGVPGEVLASVGVTGAAVRQRTQWRRWVESADGFVQILVWVDARRRDDPELLRTLAGNLSSRQQLWVFTPLRRTGPAVTAADEILELLRREGLVEVLPTTMSVSHEGHCFTRKGGRKATSSSKAAAKKAS